MRDAGCICKVVWDVRCPKHGLSKSDPRRPDLEERQTLERETRT